MIVMIMNRLKHTKYFRNLVTDTGILKGKIGPDFCAMSEQVNYFCSLEKFQISDSSEKWLVII